MSTLLTTLGWRYATKKFILDKKIPENTLSEILEAARLAPSSYGLQPYHFLVIENKELREKLRGASRNQVQITECSHLVVIQSRKKTDAKAVTDYIELVARTRGTPTAQLEDYKNRMIATLGAMDSVANQDWAKRQAYIALGFILIAAAEAQIDACPMEGIEAPQYDEILGSAFSEFQTLAVAALGYRSPEDGNQKLKKVRLSHQELFTHLE